MRQLGISTTERPQWRETRKLDGDPLSLPDSWVFWKTLTKTIKVLDLMVPFYVTGVDRRRPGNWQRFTNVYFYPAFVWMTGLWWRTSGRGSRRADCSKANKPSYSQRNSPAWSSSVCELPLHSERLFNAGMCTCFTPLSDTTPSTFTLFLIHTTGRS